MANRITTLFSFREEGRGLSKIKSDIGEVDGAWAKARTGFKSTIKEFKSSGAAQGAAIAGIGAFATKSIALASDLEESINAVTVSYGENADAVLAVGENAADSFGLARAEFNQLSVQFSSFAKQIAEREGREVADVVAELSGRVADFASVMNLEANEAAAVFMSTLSGETEPIRRFGKDVSAAAVELYALENGLISNKSELTEAIKVQARYGLLMQQTSDVAGDFANTSDSLANQQRTLAAQTQDAAAELGENLAPALATVLTGLNGIIDAADKLKILDVVNLSWVESVGTDIGQFFNALAFGDGAHEARKFADSVANAEKIAADFDMTILDGAKSFAEVRDIVEEHAKSVDEDADATHAANIVALRWNSTQKDLVDTYEAADKALLGVAESTAESSLRLSDAERTARSYGVAVEDLGAHTAELTRANQYKADSDKEAERAAEDHTQAILDHLDAQRELTEAIIDAIGGDIAYRDSQRRAAEALRDLTEAQKEFGKESGNAQEAQDDAAEAMIRQAEAAAKYAEQQAEANGKTLTAGEQAIVMREELEKIAETLAPGSALRSQLQGYIDDLARIPDERRTQITQFQVNEGLPIAPPTTVGPGGQIGTTQIGDGPLTVNRVGGGNTGVIDSRGGNHYTVQILGFANEESVQQLTKAIDEIERRRGGLQ